MLKWCLVVVLLLGWLCIAAWGQNPDFDGDGVVGFRDFFMFADVFGQEVDDTNRQCDLNQDGYISFPDFFIFADNFGREMGEPVPVGEVEIIGRVED